MKSVNKKIIESKKIIKEEKEKIKLEKKKIRSKKYEKFTKTRVGKVINRIVLLFSSEKENYAFSEVFVITLVSLVVGAFACFSLFTVLVGGKNYIKLSKDLNKFVDAYETIIDNYYGKIDKVELIDSAISGMVANVGDVYTSYSDVDGTENFNELVSGKYEGIGCTIQQLESEIKVISIYENSPSEKAGLKVNDSIISVDSKDALELGISELSEYIKNVDSKTIKMEVLRDGEKVTLSIKRGTVEIPVVSSEIHEKNGKKVGYLNVSIFSSVASKQFNDKLESLEKEGIDSLIIDVRDNNGGYLTTVVDIVSKFLSKGDIMYQIQKDKKKTLFKDETRESRKYPVAVLVNENSASASEILAAAIKESYNGFVIGTKTYGKGTVQQVRNLSDGSMIKYTVENWLSPKGNWIDDVGVIPTDEVNLDDIYYESPTTDNDSQLQKALQLVSK